MTEQVSSHPHEETSTRQAASDGPNFMDDALVHRRQLATKISAIEDFFGMAVNFACMYITVSGIFLVNWFITSYRQSWYDLRVLYRVLVLLCYAFVAFIYRNVYLYGMYHIRDLKRLVYKDRD